MDEAILHKLFKLYGEMGDSKALMPMTIHTFGNSSVATIPTMLDLIVKGKLDDHELNAGDKVIFASVGQECISMQWYMKWFNFRASSNFIKWYLVKVY